MQKKSLLVLITLVFVLGGVAGFLILNKRSKSLIKECPNEWIQDRMPTAENDNTAKQYFVIKGERKEIKDYDINWIKSTCSVQVRYVY